jgi:hypothetical protein
LALGLSVLGAAVILILSYLIWHWRTRSMVQMSQPSPYDDEFDRRTITTTLDWYILRHLQDQRRMPQRQAFLSEDRQYNALLNSYAIHQLQKQGIHLQPIASTLTEGLRPDDATHYLPRYFPDQELDSALVMFKHELIAKRLLSTIGYLSRITESRAEPLESFAELRAGYTPFVPDAYVTFYNDLVAEADDFDRAAGIRDKMRVLAVRMVFPAKEQEFNYWRDRKLKTYQVPTPVAKDAIAGWFYLRFEEVPTADSRK